MTKEAQNRNEQREQKEKGELTHPSLPSTQAKGRSSFQTESTELAEASLKTQKDKEKEKEQLTIPSLKPTKAWERSSFQQKSFGATTVGKEATVHKLAGVKATTSKHRNTQRSKLGTDQAVRNSLKETMATTPLPSGSLPKVS